MGFINKIVEKWKSSVLPKELQDELNSLEENSLYDAFYKDLEFGTGGMRGIIGVGTNRMNIYTLRKANYGYAKYLLDNRKNNVSCVIAYDCRHKSLEFAKESALVLVKYGIKVYLFSKITPTPELSFAIRYLKADGGIVITASHNPPKYNGYKIYDSDGCQLVPDLAQKVVENISDCPDVLQMELGDFDEYVKKGNIVWLDEQIDDAYLEEVKNISINNNLNKDDFKVVFTPLHGTSRYLGPRLLKELGYNFILVEEQMVQDPNFSTVSLPNPEDKKAFDLSIKYAKENNADICIATDPDADRVGLAVKYNDEYVLLNGNQTGALLIYYLVNNRIIDKDRTGVIFNTIVTSPLGVKIGESYGLESFSTLTGFKFIGEQAKLLENDKMRFFYFGYEESYGYVIKDFVRDKDSLQALLMCSEMACYYKNQNKTLIDVLNEIYNKYGYYEDDLVNIGLEGAEGAKRIDRILNHFRTSSSLNFDSFKVTVKEDYYTQKRFDYEKQIESNLTLPISNVIKYYLNDGSFFVLRPSGTEPKMKLYICGCSTNKEVTRKKISEIKEKVMRIINEVK